MLWLEFLTEANIIPSDQAKLLWAECDQILRIVSASIKTARGK